MIIIPEQISYLREQREKLKESIESYKDYLQNKEIVSSDYSARAFVGDSLTDEQLHRDRQNLRTVTEILESSDYLTERQLDQIGIGTKFVVKFKDYEDTDTMILTDCVYGLGFQDGLVSISSPLGSSVLGKRTGMDFAYVVKTGASPLDRRSVSGAIVEIVRDPNEYIHYLNEKAKCVRTSKPVKRRMHELLNDSSDEAKAELATYATITPSQKYLLQIEEEKLSHKKDPSSIARLAVVRKLLRSKVVTDIPNGIISVGSKFELALVGPDQTMTTHSYEMINSAVSTELEDAYVERISPLGDAIYGLHEHETFKFRKDNKTYTGEVLSIKESKKEDEYLTPLQYRKK